MEERESGAAVTGDASKPGSGPRVILFPGLGADPRMFHRQRGAIPGLETPGWIRHVRRESLREYVARFAATLDVKEPAVLGGVSLGGIVALEMARVVPAKCVVMIASARSTKKTNRALVLSERVSRLVPTPVLDAGRVLAPIFVGTGGTLPREDKRLLVRMAREVPAEFLRWAARAVLEWEGLEPPLPSVPVYQIHGDCDNVFPLRTVRPDRVIRGGMHVLNLSHPEVVNEFILECAGRAR